VTLISFTLVYVLPGNPALVKAGSLATPEHVAAIERQMGLDRPVHVQYWRYSPACSAPTSARARARADPSRGLPAARARHPGADAGQSARGGGDRHSARGALRRHRDTALDHASRLVGVGGVAMPSFWTGLLLLYVFFTCSVCAAAARAHRGDVVPPTRLTGLYVIDAALTGHGTALLSALHHLMLPRSRWASP